jgi:hypothetical protein
MAPFGTRERGMSPEQTQLIEKRFSDLAATGTSVEMVAWAALNAEGLSSHEEHAGCRETLTRVADALREREKSLRKSALKAGPRGRHRR